MNLSKERIEWIRGEGSCEKAEWLALCDMALELRTSVSLSREEAGKVRAVLEGVKEKIRQVGLNTYSDDGVLQRLENTTVGCEQLRDLFIQVAGIEEALTILTPSPGDGGGRVIGKVQS